MEKSLFSKKKSREMQSRRNKFWKLVTKAYGEFCGGKHILLAYFSYDSKTATFKMKQCCLEGFSVCINECLLIANVHSQRTKFIIAEFFLLFSSKQKNLSTNSHFSEQTKILNDWMNQRTKTKTNSFIFGTEYRQKERMNITCLCNHIIM
jgi:hypothetical protein